LFGAPPTGWRKEEKEYNKMVIKTKNSTYVVSEGKVYKEEQSVLKCVGKFDRLGEYSDGEFRLCYTAEDGQYRTSPVREIIP
jgi:hypothetical protein